MQSKRVQIATQLVSARNLSRRIPTPSVSVYRAEVTFSSSDDVDPVEVTVFQNDLGSASWSFVVTGSFNLTIPGAFTANKTVVRATGVDRDGRIVNGYRVDNDTVRLSAVLCTTAAANNVGGLLIVEVLVHQ